VWLKIEGANPTGSFKDRGMTVAISKALEEGAKAVVCGSTGNTSASAAAYAARAGLTCAVLIPEGYIALGKLAQALIHGARVLQIRANFDVALDIVRQLGDEAPVTVVNSINPYRIEGQKTGAFEIVDVRSATRLTCTAFRSATPATSLPTGRATGSTRTPGDHEAAPKMLGFQAAGAAPIVEGHPIDNPETIATAIRIGRRPRGTAPPRPLRSPGARSRRSPTTRSSRPTATSLKKSPCFASRRRRLQSPGC
jgi:threonine synthase